MKRLTRSYDLRIDRINKASVIKLCIVFLVMYAFILAMSGFGKLFNTLFNIFAVNVKIFVKLNGNKQTRES